MLDRVIIRLSRINFIFLVLLFRGLLDLAYHTLVTPYYAYQGFVLKPGPTSLIFLSYLLVVVTASTVPMESTSPSKFMIGFLYLVSYVPATSLLAFGGFPVTPTLWLTLIFVLLFHLSKINLISKLDFSFSKSSEFLFLLVFGLYIFFFLILIAKYSFKLPTSILNVYGTREEYKQSLTGESRLIGYALIWLGNIVIPFIAAWGLINRKMINKIIIVSIAIFSQLEVFAIAGFKSHLFAIIFIAWILAGVRFFRKNLLRYTVLSFSILVIIAGVVDYSRPSNLPVMSATFTQRIFFDPALLYNRYYQFFSQNPKTYLAESFPFSRLIKYPYNLSTPRLIGDFFYPFWKQPSANANMWADAYANFGVVGMFSFTLLFWLLINVINSISEGKNIYLVYVLIAMPLFSLTNVGLPTTMLTNGMLLSLVLLMLLPQAKSNSMKLRETTSSTKQLATQGS